MPELKKAIESADNVMSLWIEIWHPFCKAYERSPRDEDFITRVYNFADWCASAPETSDAATDPATAVTVAFLEHLPKHPQAREDMPRWFTAEQVLRSRAVFSYHLDEQPFDDLLSHMRRNASAYTPRSYPDLS